MQFPYQCQKCGKRHDEDFSIGKAPREVPCPSCGSAAKRIYEGMSVAVKIDGAYHRSSNFGERMKARNVATAARMKGKKPGLRLAGYQYESGKVEEVH